MNSYTRHVTLAKKGSNAKMKGIAKSIDQNRLHSGFWLGKDSTSLWGRSLTGSGTSNTVQLIKLRSYQRAVSNFVKILTNKEIPVVFHEGGDSFTNGKRITLTSKIDNKNFDVVVGLALHEASHIVLTDFNAISEYMDSPHFMPQYTSHTDVMNWKSLLNWIEDRRIDNYIITQSPGYKGYYDKLYDHYFKGKEIAKFFKTAKAKQLTDDTYMTHIINMMSPAFDKNALPGLAEIVDLIDLANIERLTSTIQVCAVAVQVLDIIKRETIKADEPNNCEGDNAEGDNADGDKGKQDQAAAKLADQDDEDDEADKGDEADQDDEADQGDEDLTVRESIDLEQAIAAQRDFVNHAGKNKTSANSNVAKRLRALSDMDVEVQTVGGDASKGNKTYSALLYDLTQNRKFWSAAAESVVVNPTPGNTNPGLYEVWPNMFYKVGTARKVDVEMLKCLTNAQIVGKHLGKKLRLVSESRELVYNRLSKGHLDKRRVACLGYELESVFDRTFTDSTKSANLHLSIDVSGSMSGDRITEASKLAVTIATAATTTQGKIKVQISLRGTDSGNNNPETVIIYNSQYNTILQLIHALTLLSCNSTTPEGLCFESMQKRGIFLPTTSEVDSYFLNLSDGEPSMSKYYGNYAEMHTRSQINLLKQKGIHIISYFIGNGNIDTSNSGRAFKVMYGNDARMIDANSINAIAKTLNDKFLTAKVTR